MTSWEEDAYFQEWGWEKDLIKRCYWAPDGRYITFDTVMSLSSSGSDGEAELKGIIRRYGERHAESNPR